jgi:hypothetical protein
MLRHCFTPVYFIWLAVLVFECCQATDNFLAYDTDNLADAEQIQIAQSLQQEGDDEQFRGNSGVKKGGENIFDEGSAIQLTRQDELLAVSAGNTEGAMGLMRQRLASEEQFNERLQQLLTKSTSETRSKQDELIALRQKLAATEQAKKNLRSNFLRKKAEEDAAFVKLRSQDELVGNQLRTAAHKVNVQHNAIKLFRKRMSTVLSHLRNVTRLGKNMEKELADEKSKEAMKDHELLAFQRETGLDHHMRSKWEAKLRKAQAVRDSDEARWKAIEHENLLLRQRVASSRQRDRGLQNDNMILRKQLQEKNHKEEKELSELDIAKASLAEVQKSNAELQYKYAASIQNLD